MTKRNIIDRILLIASGGDLHVDNAIQEPETILALEDGMNAVMKSAVLETNYTFDGGTIPDGSLLVPVDIPVIFAAPSAPAPTLPGPLPIVQTSGTSLYATATLPFTPMLLPYGAGVWKVEDKDDPAKRFIPLRPGEAHMLRGNVALSPLLPMGTFTYQSGKLLLEYGGPTPPTTLRVTLCAVPFSRLADNDPVPVPPEFIEEVVKRALQVLGITQSPPPADTKGRNNPALK